MFHAVWFIVRVLKVFVGVILRQDYAVQPLKTKIYNDNWTEIIQQQYRVTGRNVCHIESCQRTPLETEGIYPLMVTERFETRM